MTTTEQGTGGTAPLSILPAARAVDLVKTYGKGDAVVHALERDHRRIREWALHRGHGAVGIRQVHPHALHGRT